MSAALLLGLGIGAAAGISPGPLMVLVIAATLRSGWRAGALAACAPLITDGLLVLGGRPPEFTLNGPTSRRLAEAPISSPWGQLPDRG